MKTSKEDQAKREAAWRRRKAVRQHTNSMKARAAWANHTPKPKRVKRLRSA